MYKLIIESRFTIQSLGDNSRIGEERRKRGVCCRGEMLWSGENVAYTFELKRMKLISMPQDTTQYLVALIFIYIYM